MRFRNVHSCDWMLYLTFKLRWQWQDIGKYTMMALRYLVPVWVVHSWKYKYRGLLLCRGIICRMIAQSLHNYINHLVISSSHFEQVCMRSSFNHLMTCSMTRIIVLSPHTWPSLTTNIALQFLIVLSLCAMVMLVLPSWALSKALKTLLSLSVSKADVASSSNRTGGFLINARAMAIRCFWPGSWEISIALCCPFILMLTSRKLGTLFANWSFITLKWCFIHNLLTLRKSFTWGKFVINWCILAFLAAAITSNIGTSLVLSP